MYVAAACPPRLPASRWLEHYASVFDTVEVNSTFYRLAKPKAVARAAAVQDDIAAAQIIAQAKIPLTI